MSAIYTLGIDIGSTTVKIAIVTKSRTFSFSVCVFIIIPPNFAFRLLVTNLVLNFFGFHSEAENRLPIKKLTDIFAVFQSLLPREIMDYWFKYCSPIGRQQEMKFFF